MSGEMNKGKYVLIDISRTESMGKNMYWKYNNHGYVADIKEARLWTREEAAAQLAKPGNTKYVRISLEDL